METLGERIRTLRKQQKLTLETLAGDELTKGMLSLIENNKAKPSMESLAYIAKRLGVEISELLEEVSNVELKTVLDKAEILFNTKVDQLTDEYTKLIAMVKPYVSKLSTSYGAARLLEIYSRCLRFEKMEGWESFIEKAAKMYEQLNLNSGSARIGMYRSMVIFSEHDYEGALDLLLQLRSEFEEKHAFIEPITQLDFDYHEAILQYAVGNAEAAVRVMERAIQFSKEHDIFYRIGDLYRLASAHAMMQEDEEQYLYYLNKLNQYGHFADDQISLYFSGFIEVHYLNTYQHRYKEALDIVEDDIENGNIIEDYIDYLYLEQGKALYGLGEFENALTILQKVVIMDYLHHPIDLSMFYVVDAYIGMCHLKLNRPNKAMEHAQKAMDSISPLPPSPYKDFIQTTYKFITDETKKLR